MNISFQQIGEVCATFAADHIPAGTPVKVSGPKSVAPCADGDPFCGIVVHTTDDACSVQLRGFAVVPVSGPAPTPGFADLTADGSGGVKSSSAANARSFLVADTDPSAHTATILL